MEQLSLRNVGAGAQFDPDRTFWQLLFPLGGREVVERDGEPEVLDYDAAFLGTLEANYRARVRLMMAHGMPPQPLLVSYHHAIERRAYLQEDVPAEALDRAGGIYDLHAHMDDSQPGIPRGLWGLTEWTWRAMSSIDDRTLHVLSPAVGPFKTLEMTEPLPGPSLLGMALVDLPAIEGIGTAQDRLPWWTFNARNARPIGDITDMAQTMRRAVGVSDHAKARANIWEAQPVQIELRRHARWLSFADEQAEFSAPITEPASTVDPTEDHTMTEPTTENVETRSAEEAPETSETPATLDRDAVVEIVKVELRSLTETLPATIAEAVEQAFTLRAAADESPETPVENVETEEVPEAGDVLIRCEQAEQVRIEGIVLRAVTEGQLLRTNAPAALERLRKGEPIADLCGDYTDVAMRAGSIATTGDAAPPAESDAPAEITEAELAAEARAAVDNPAAAFAKSVELRAAHEANGTRIVFKRSA